MDERNIFAHTDPAPAYPEYLSINERDGKIEITVRGPRVGDDCGPCATMTLPPDKLRALVHGLIAIPIGEAREATPEMIEAGAQALLGFYAREITDSADPKSRDDVRQAKHEAARCWRYMAAVLVGEGQRHPKPAPLIPTPSMPIREF